MKVYAPAKLILSGEHAVVYGSPAIALAINRYATATVTRELLPQILFDLSDLAHRSRLSMSGLHQLKDRIKHKYRRFVRGDVSIRDVLHKPSELAQLALGIFTESQNVSIPHGVRIHVRSTIPMGCGMGSSAATILSVMYAISNYLSISLSQDEMFQMALQAENLQHGYSSGLDLRVALQGGCIYKLAEQVESRLIPTLPMYLINTGTPVSTTGQCVEKVAPAFENQQLVSEFTSVTNRMDIAIQQHDQSGLREAVKDNQLLLKKIGVVPDKVQRFIAEVEKMHGVAKICGAGAVSGENAGAVLALADNATDLSALCNRFDYTLIPVCVEPRGVHVI